MASGKTDPSADPVRQSARDLATRADMPSAKVEKFLKGMREI